MRADAVVRRADLEACRAILRAGSQSFAAAAALLPRRVRDPATVLYAFCRVADDCVDRADGDRSARRDAVAEVQARITRAYAAAPAEDPVDRAFSAVVLRERVPQGLPRALLEGFAWDAEGRTYETLDDLYAYAARVAGSVGAMMTLLMGPRAPSVLSRACDLGIAMQLTNIARDVGEDAARGRIYLPLAWMREADVDPEAWMRAPAYDARLARVTARLLESAEALYARADAGVPMLPPDCRVAIRAARLIYAEIGRVVAKRRFDSVSGRARVSRIRKAWLLVRALGARWSRVLPVEAPPLEPTRFLVDAAGAT